MTSFPINSMDCMTCLWVRAATFIWKVNRDKPPSASLWRLIFSATSWGLPTTKAPWGPVCIKSALWSPATNPVPCQCGQILFCNQGKNRLRPLQWWGPHTPASECPLFVCLPGGQRHPRLACKRILGN